MDKKYEDIPLTQMIWRFVPLILCFVAVFSLLTFLLNWNSPNQFNYIIIFVLSLGFAGIIAGLDSIIHSLRAEEETK